MDPDTQLEIVRSLLERTGVELRYARLGGEGGGLCRLKGRQVVFLDLDADLATRLDRCIRALAELPELGGVFVPPAVRDLIDRARVGLE